MCCTLHQKLEPYTCKCDEEPTWVHGGYLRVLLRGRGEGTDVPAQQGDVEMGIRKGVPVAVHAGMMV